MSATILVVDDEENARHYIDSFLTAQGYEVVGAATMNEARHFLNTESADIVLLDVKLPDGWGPSLLEETAQLPARPPIILITAYGDIDMAVDAMKNGAHDFLQKPVQFEQLQKTIKRAEEIVAMRKELAHLRLEHQHQDFIVGKSQKIKNLLDQAQRAASKSVSLLITGETGTGKDHLANVIRQMGPRTNKPYIPVNCAAIQSTMLESELFGHEAGAFTGADKRKPGLMEIADEGILFLDEISSMPLDMQAKLLRVLEDQIIRRVGGTKEIKLDVQILTASNRDLPTLISENKFRQDLYYRLKVVDLHMPPLRERKEDIPEFVGLFIRHYNAKQGININGVTPKAMEALTSYNWPGNIRELRNAIERATLFCDDPLIDLAHLPSDIISPQISVPG
jgi:two-component system response regulator AtoC